MTPSLTADLQMCTLTVWIENLKLSASQRLPSKILRGGLQQLNTSNTHLQRTPAKGDVYNCH